MFRTVLELALTERFEVKEDERGTKEDKFDVNDGSEG